MTTPDDMPAPVALLLEVSRARHAVQRARRLPGLPLLAVGRPATGAGGARGPGGELPWAAGLMPGSRPDRADMPATTPQAVPGTLSSWPAVGHRPAEAPISPAPFALPVIPELPRADPARPASPTPLGLDSPPPHRRAAANGTAPPAEMRPLPHPLPAPARLVEIAPGMVPAGRQRRDAARTTPPGLAGLPGKIATATVMRRHTGPASPRIVPWAPHAAPALRSAPPAATLTAFDRAFPPGETPQPSPASVTRPTPADTALTWAEPRQPLMERLPSPDPAHVAAASTRTQGPAPLPAPTLVQRDPRAAPASVSKIIALGEGIQRSVRQELDEMRDMVTRLGRQSAPPTPSAQPPAPAAATGDAARHLLGRMRTMLQEEQFRRGHIR